jgi:outer membrane murein-binding lipoprotein Lpp
MYKIMKLMLLIIFVSLIAGCNNKDKEMIDNLKKENQQLKIQITQLKKKINEPKQLILLIKKYLQQKNSNKVKKILKELLDKYPSERNNKEVGELIQENEELIQEKKKKEQKLMKTLNKYMEISKDDIDNITWYQPKLPCFFDDFEMTVLYAYIGQDNETKKPWLRIVVRYQKKDWLFIHKFVIVTDNKKYTYEKKFKREVLHNGLIKEWIDFYANEEDIKMLYDLAKSKKFKLRLYGTNYYEDQDNYCLSYGKDSLLRTLQVYNILLKQYKNENK